MIPLKDNIPTERFPVVTVALILINVLVFLLFQHPAGFSSVDNAKVIKYGAIPYELSHPGKHCAAGNTITPNGTLVQTGSGGATTIACQGTDVTVQNGTRVAIRHVPSQPATWLTVFFSMFMHGGFLHIAGNMLFLWIFGNNIEDAMGHGRFVAFYLLGGIAALAGQTLFSPDSMVPTIGASGAIAAVLGGYLLLYPRARVVTVIFIVIFFTIVELPAVLVLGAWFVIQALYGAADLANPTGGGGGVAHFAHVGGFVFGLLLIKAFATRHRRLAPPAPFAR